MKLTMVEIRIVQVLKPFRCTFAVEWSQLRSYVKAEVAVLDFSSLTVLMVCVAGKRHWT